MLHLFKGVNTDIVNYRKRCGGDKLKIVVCIMYSVMWIATAAAVVAGVIYLDSIWCLLGLLAPTCVNISVDEYGVLQIK